MQWGGSRVYLPKRHHLGRRIIACGSYEPEVISIITAFAQSGSVVLDVGANIGLIAVALFERKMDIQVVSFEPSPNSLPYLQRTWDVSPFKDQWRIVNSGCGSREGCCELRMASIADGAFDSFIANARVPVANTLQVPVVALDSWWRENGRPNISAVKIDVEGAERFVLEGMPELLSVCAPVLVVEWNLRHIPVPEQSWLLEFSRSAGRVLVESTSLAQVSSLSEIRVHLERGRDTFAVLPP